MLVNSVKIVFRILQISRLHIWVILMSGIRIAQILANVSISGRMTQMDWIEMGMVGVVNHMDDEGLTLGGQRMESRSKRFFGGRYLCDIGLVGWIVIIIILLALIGGSNSGSSNNDPEGGYEPDVCYDAPQPYFC